MVIHRLADRGLIDYDLPVAGYWPEFAAAGKDRITVRELLSHRAGLYDVQAVAHNADELLDHLGMERRLAAATPQGPPGRPAYHAITYGWLASGLARAVTGKGMRDLVRTELAEPLGTSGLEIGTGGGPDQARRDGRSLAPHLHARSASPQRPCSAGCPSPGPASAPSTPRASRRSAVDRIRPSGGPRCRPSTAP